VNTEISNIDHFEDNQHTATVRILKSTFKPGDEVQVQLRRGGNWYDAIIRHTELKVWFNICSDGSTEVMDSAWQHSCNVIDERVTTEHFTAIEANGRWKYWTDNIREKP
jgi:exosome complex RNA-binding protein Csl4